MKRDGLDRAAQRTHIVRHGHHDRLCGMATMIVVLYDALKAAGAPDDQARKAAEVVAGYENRFARIETDLTLLKWMVGFNLAMTIGVVTLLLRHWSGSVMRAGVGSRSDARNRQQFSDASQAFLLQKPRFAVTIPPAVRLY